MQLLNFRTDLLFAGCILLSLLAACASPTAGLLDITPTATPSTPTTTEVLLRATATPSLVPPDHTPTDIPPTVTPQLVTSAEEILGGFGSVVITGTVFTSSSTQMTPC